MTNPSRRAWRGIEADLPRSSVEVEMELLLIILLILMLAGALPVYGRWGMPGGIVTVLCIILIILLLTGRL